ncbi:DUF2963 domain-containing protein [Candidatus Phytoplasma australiense]|uniref:DUF2963 domain-containing protein n=1 Tax=Strawberry lethal yellows phytoplasma (CPA) str. NZSb11 TaxID=980422 RepID=R4S2H6_PHYAS|nr:DUF2963 domain-containing protein [Candidatus Phytoplasma australiense]AGL90993.1 Hypothetical Protein SLY_1087 [Strawberry lethal yellows phytoplasma (CPA) str. NZSb11]
MNYQKTYYYLDGKTKKSVVEYGPDGKLTKYTEYYSDGKTIDYINELNQKEEVIKTTCYYPDGNIKEVQYSKEYYKKIIQINKGE